MHPLDNPVWSALTGPQRVLAEGSGSAVRFRSGRSLFGAFANEPGPADWEAMAGLIGPGGVVITAGPTGAPPEGWSVEYSGDGLQMTGEVLAGDVVTAGDGDRVEPLGADDVEDMLALVEVAQPGPFTRRTWELGGYVGVRSQGRLVAMAGERMHPQGWGEISAVATHPDHRRQGLAELVVRAVAAGIVGRGDLPVLHVATSNVGALRLYSTMGFLGRRTIRFQAVRAPA